MASDNAETNGRSSETAAAMKLAPRRGLSKLAIGLIAVCVALFLADFFIHKHGKFEIEHLPGFYALAGFAGAFALGLIAKFLSGILKQDEDFYER